MRLAMIASLALVACAPPDAEELFNRVDVSVEQTPADASRHFVDLIDDAEDSVHICLPSIEDTSLSDALIAAYDRGVEVEVATDIDMADTEGALALAEAGVPLTLADDGIAYFEFAFNIDVEWSSEETIMSHSFVVVDGYHVANATAVGDLAEGPRVVFDAVGEELAEDLWTEHNQIFGGADCTATTAYDALAKSIADYRWRYGTSTDEGLEIFFGPQERLTKRVVDAAYSARASVWVVTDDYSNEGLSLALKEKVALFDELGYDFDARVIVGPNFGTVSPSQANTLSRDTPGVRKRQLDIERLPTMVLVDYERSPVDGRRHHAKAMVLSHDLFAAARLFRGAEVINDQLIDGSMWVLDDFDSPSEDMTRLEDLFWELWEQGEGL